MRIIDYVCFRHDHPPLFLLLIWRTNFRRLRTGRWHHLQPHLTLFGSFTRIGLCNFSIPTYILEWWLIDAVSDSRYRKFSVLVGPLDIGLVRSQHHWRHANRQKRPCPQVYDCRISSCDTWPWDFAGPHLRIDIL